MAQRYGAEALVSLDADRVVFVAAQPCAGRYTLWAPRHACDIQQPTCVLSDKQDLCSMPTSPTCHPPESHHQAETTGKANLVLPLTSGDQHIQSDIPAAQAPAEGVRSTRRRSCTRAAKRKQRTPPQSNAQRWPEQLRLAVYRAILLYHPDNIEAIYSSLDPLVLENRSRQADLRCTVQLATALRELYRQGGASSAL